MVMIEERQPHTKNKWNIRDLEPPPQTTYKVYTALDITGLRNSFEAAVQFFENQTHFDSDVTLLSRTVLRMKNKFRTDKGFKFMQKLNKILQKYFELNFISVASNFYELLPKVFQPGDYLPTSNMLDYVIVRLQGLTALLCHIAETAKAAAHLMEERVAIGHFWKVAFFAYTLLSRIWFLCNSMITFCCKFYKNILPMRNILGKGNNTWAGDSYEFPRNLESWLNNRHLKYELSPNGSSILPSEKVHNVDCLSNELMIDNKEGTNAIRSSKPKSAFELLLEDEEIGETTEEIKHVPLKRTKKRKTKSKETGKLKTKDISTLQLIENIKSFKLLKIFLKKETDLRTKNCKKCIFKNLDGLQWNMLQNRMKKLSKKAAANKNKQSVQLNKAISTLKSLL